MDEVDNKVAEMSAQSKYEKILEEIDNINCFEGWFNSGHLRKLKEKLSPKCRDPPKAMLDKAGNLMMELKSLLSIHTRKG